MVSEALKLLLVLRRLILIRSRDYPKQGSSAQTGFTVQNKVRDHLELRSSEVQGMKRTGDEVNMLCGVLN